MAASITTENLEIKIAQAATKLQKDLITLANLKAQLPAAVAKQKAATKDMVDVGLVVNNLINTYVRNRNIFGQWERDWIRSPENTAIWNAYGGHPVTKALQDVNAAKVILAQKEGLLRIANMELTALNAPLAIANKAVTSGQANIKALQKSLATELAKPDTSAAKAAAQAVIDQAVAALDSAKQATSATKAALAEATALKNTKLAAYSVAHGITLKAQATFNTLNAKAAQEKLRKQVLTATTAALEAAQAALTAALGNEEIPANAEYKAAVIQLSNATIASAAAVKAEAKATAALAAARQALARIK